MESSPPFPIEPGERVLAAIVFTDVVNFTARVQAAEVTTLSLLEQDFVVMRKYCERYSGWVLKSTGDGLLLYFSSAVQAMTCAMQIQLFFNKRSKAEPVNKPLTHRIGVHLGDVFVKDEDVMGDGVNIASRLQSVADPGGICISQTVYDVVKNKLSLEVDRLPPREVKNIAEVGTIYRVLLEPRKLSATSVEFRPPTRTARVFSSTEKVLAIAALAVAVAVVGHLIYRADADQKAALAASQTTQAALDALLKSKGAAVPVQAAAETTAPVVAPAPVPTSEEIDFAALTLKPASRPDVPAAAMRERATELTQVLLQWVKAAMTRYTKDAPLLVPRLTASMPAELKVFTDADNRYVFATGGAARARGWDELKLADQEALILSTLHDSPSAPPAEVIRGADAFAFLHELPEMVIALHPGAK